MSDEIFECTVVGVGDDVRDRFFDGRARDRESERGETLTTSFDDFVR